MTFFNFATFRQSRLFLRYVSENGAHTIGVSDFVDEEVRQHFEDELDIPISRYLGAEVIQINGMQRALICMNLSSGARVYIYKVQLVIVVVVS